MSESVRIIWALFGLLLAAGLLTYLTNGSSHELRYELSKKKKKRRKKKRQMATEYSLTLGEDKEKNLTTDASQVAQ